MKKIIYLLFIPALFTACNSLSDDKTQERKLFDEVISIHNEVMNYEGMILENKAKLDTLAKTQVDKSVQDSALALSENLNIADAAMSEWMHQFEPDYSQKTHEEAMKYLADQKASITQVDSVTKKAIKASWQFLSNHKQ
ncbi:hypothetical protein LT679_04155 [Mucilaginibacter roseus]|uniref:Viral A-type inclusion protein n=1 Tax=Mucilaginibacter roseus TaxID=1528868 RepID=A0ABS8U2K6_9SPHI|nr:hypothetical protein [Mucilaginibacter roseus]MCD8739786.1 hypothetical protein [Mucilaginibacter roseus]